LIWWGYLPLSQITPNLAPALIGVTHSAAACNDRVMDDDLPDMPRRIEALFRDAIDNIRLLKRQHWAITKYAILVDAAIYALVIHYPGHCTVRVLLTVLAAIVLGYGVIVLINFQSSMTKFRNRIAWIYVQPYYTDEQRKVLELGTQPKGFWHDPMFLIGLIGVLAVGCAIVITVIWTAQPSA
jgi:hypothetical protein